MKPYDPTGDKKSQIRAMFDNIAPTYDRLNHMMSMNIDRLWRRRTVETVARRAPQRVLDVATGTGDMALALARRLPGAVITGADISEQMLGVARRKIAAAGLEERISLVAADAERLPFDDDAFDAVTVAFGVRNFGDIGVGLRELHRVLRPGGMLAVLELSTPGSRPVRALYNLYAHRILPWMGSRVSRDRKAYEYLPASVDEFPSAERFSEMVRAAGFSCCKARSQSLGTAYIYESVK